MWFTTFRNHILFALSGHVIFAKICSMMSPKVPYVFFLPVHNDQFIYKDLRVILFIVLFFVGVLQMLHGFMC